MLSRNAEEFIRERLRAADPVWRYCHLFSPRQIQPELRSAFVFYLELEDIFFRSLDPALQESRLAWWRNELEQAGAGKTSLPALQFLNLQNQPHLVSWMTTALDRDNTGGAIFKTIQAIAGCVNDEQVFQCGQVWFGLRSSRLLKKPITEQAAQTELSGLARPLAVLSDLTAKYELDAAGFKPLFSAWQAARRAEAESDGMATVLP